MRKFRLVLLLAALVSVLSVGGLVACSKPSPSPTPTPTPTPETTLESIAVTSLPNKTEYTVGDTFDYTGAAVTATYSDSSTASVALNECTFTGYDMSLADTYTVTVTYKGKTDTFEITVAEVKPPVDVYYDVTFDKNSEYAVSGMPEKQNVKNGEAAQAPADPQSFGFAFDGWYTKSNVKFDFDDAITGDITLYAHWTAIGYTVVYDIPNGATNAADNVAIYKITDGEVELRNAKKDNYNFNGWFTTPELTPGTVVTKITPDLIPENGDEIKLYAKMSPDTYVIEFVFKGTEQTYTARFKDGYTAPDEYAYGTSVLLPTADDIEIVSHDGNTYSFIGWYEDDASEIVTAITTTDHFSKLFTASITAAQVYTVTFHNGYEQDNAERFNVVENGTVQYLQLTREHYTLDGWYEDGSDTAYDFATPVTGDLELYAKWTPVKYTVTFVSDSGATISAVKYDYGTKATAATAPEKLGYKFVGWAAASGDMWDFDSDVVGGNVTLYAKYTPMIYSINYVLGDGINGDNQTTYNIEEDVELVAATSTAEGYYFIGWYSAAEGGDKVDRLDPDIVSRANAQNVITLYALYDNKYTVTFDANGGTLDGAATAEVIAEYGTAVEQPSNPTQSGYTFDGWLINNGTAWVAYDFQTPISGDVTLMAKWKSNPKSGTYLYGSMTGWAPNTDRPATSNNNDTEWKISGVTLSDGDEFVLVTYDASGNIDNDKWVKPTDGLAQYAYSEIIEITKNSSGNFAVKVVSDVYADAKWTLYIKKDGSGISLDISVGENELRSPSGVGSASVAETETAAVYIRGNFTDGYKSSPEWSSDNAEIAQYIDGKYYFTGVYFKRYDAFKVYSTDGGLWMGGSFTTLGTPIALTDDNNADNVRLNDIADGMYNLVFDAESRTLTVYESATLAATLDKEYFVGETPVKADLTVTYGGKAVTEFELAATVAVSGENSVTVIYNGAVAVLKYTAVDVKVTGVELTSQPAKTSYKLGDAADNTGIALTAKNNDGSAFAVALADMSFDYGDNYDGDKFVKSGSVTVTVGYGAFSAKFEISVDPFTVTFDANGGAAVAAVYVTTYGGMIALAEPVYDEHHIFDGWYLASERVEGSLVITNDVELVAKWSLKEYTVTFQTDDTVISRVKVTYGSTVAEPATKPEKPSATFAGWRAVDATENYVFSTPVSGDITLVAQWSEKDVFTVTFVDTDGSELRTVQVVDGENVTSFVPEKTGYTFDGWYSSDALTSLFDFTSAISAHTNIYAKWNINKHKLTYYFEDGAVYGEQTVEYGANIVRLVDPEKTGYTFDGWYADDTYAVKYVFATMPDNAVQVYGRFVVIEYTVTFDANGGTLATGADATVKVEYGGTVEQPDDPTRNGFEFIGWYSSGAEYAFDSAVVSDLTLTAEWKAIVKLDGIYANGVFVKALVPDGDSTTKVKVESVALMAGDVITFYKDNAQITKDVYVRGGLENGEMTGSSYSNITVNKSGYFNIYYNPSDNDWENGLWVVYSGEYVEPDLTDGDGLYAGGELLITFKPNNDGANEVMAENLRLDDQTTIEFKYGGATVAVQPKDDCPLGTFNTDGTVTLNAGTYSFYYDYANNVMWISGTPDVAEDRRVEVTAGTGNGGHSDVQNMYLVGKFGDMDAIDNTKGYLVECTSYNNGNSYQCAVTVDLKAGDIVAIYVPGWPYTIPFSAIENADYFEEDTASGYYKVTADGTYTFYYKHYYNSGSEHAIYVAKA